MQNTSTSNFILITITGKIPGIYNKKHIAD